MRKPWLLVCFLVLLAGCAEKRIEAIDASVDRIKETYGLEVLYQEVPASTCDYISFEPYSDKSFSRAKKLLNLIEEELVPYNADFLKNVGVRRIHIVWKLSLDGYDPRANFCEDILYLDASTSIVNSQYGRHVFHHELFHIIDFGPAGLFSITEQPDLNLIDIEKGMVNLSDAKDWTELNPIDFEYGPGGRACNESGNSRTYDHPEVGFVSTYATCSKEEDLAETYASLFTKKGLKMREKYEGSDPLLTAKWEWMRKYIRSLGMELK